MHNRITGVIVPPNLALSIFLLGGMTIMFGMHRSTLLSRPLTHDTIAMCIGWAFGNAAMAAALHARSATLLARQEASFAASCVSLLLYTCSFVLKPHRIDPHISVVLQKQIAAYRGHFLDPR